MYINYTQIDVFKSLFLLVKIFRLKVDKHVIYNMDLTPVLKILMKKCGLNEKYVKYLL